MPSNAELVQTMRATLGDVEALRLDWSLGEAAKIKSSTWEAELRELAALVDGIGPSVGSIIFGKTKAARMR